MTGVDHLFPLELIHSGPKKRENANALSPNRSSKHFPFSGTKALACDYTLSHPCIPDIFCHYLSELLLS